MGRPGPCQMESHTEGQRYLEYRLKIGEEEVPNLKEVVKMAERNCANLKIQCTNARSGN